MTYQPPYPPGPNSGNTAPYASPPPPRRRSWPPWVALTVAVAFLGSGAWYAYEHKIRKDSGIVACQAFRDNKTMQGAPVDTTKDGKMTQAQYLQLRKVFQDSHYDDIRAAGTKMMDVLWQVTSLGPDAGLEALPYVGQMTSALTEMQGACANHGIVVNLNPASTPQPITTN